MSPYQDGYFIKTLYAMEKSILYIADYHGTELKPLAASGSNDNIRNMEFITNGHAIYPKNEMLLQGWVIGKTGYVKAKISNENKGDLNLDMYEDQALYNSFLGDGKKYFLSENLRFNEKISMQIHEKMKLKLFSNGHLIDEVNLVKGMQKDFETDEYVLHFDKISFADESLHKFEETVAKLPMHIGKEIRKVYVSLGRVLLFLGSFSYILLTIGCFAQYFKYRNSECSIYWIIASSAIGSLVVIITGVSYTAVSQFDAINVGYLSATYPLFLIFSLISIVGAKEFLLKLLKVK